MRKNPGRRERRNKEHKEIHIPGRTLNQEAVDKATQWRDDRINLLKSKKAKGTATLKELRELRWKWGIK
jgi:hypothetical protein